MRKIAFRGKRIDMGEWVYGDLVRNENGAFAVVPPFKMNSHNECSTYEVEENTIGQFTGLKDSNGKEIYEGDILRVELANGTVREYQVVWHDSGFYVDMKEIGYTPLGMVDKKRIEIVGNIHDGQDLQEGGKNEPSKDD